MPQKKTTNGFEAISPSGAVTGILRDLRGLIAEARQDVARQVNSTLVLLTLADRQANSPGHP